MKKSLGFCLLVLMVVTGCVSNSELKKKERAAFLAGQRQGQATQINGSSVWIVGNVRNPSIPWTEDLTLSRALVEANYLGAGDPGQIIVVRNGQAPKILTGRQLLGGYDMPLLAGDRVEIHP